MSLIGIFAIIVCFAVIIGIFILIAPIVGHAAKIDKDDGV